MLKRWWGVFLLVLVEVGIVWANVRTGTWLIGWDSTQPELAFSTHLWRDLSSVWQEYRGLGMTDAMAHAANLVHVGYAWLLSLVLPTNYVRYAYVLLMHLMGGVGMYVLSMYILRKQERVRQGVAIVTALFYMLNPYTVQMFYQPLELFVMHFAALPWGVWALLTYFDAPERKKLWRLLIINFLAIPQAHVPTIFIVYGLTIFTLIVSYWMKHWRVGWKRVRNVVVVLFAVNAFWGLPYIYSAMTSAAGINASKSSQLSNSEVVLRNAEYGDIRSVVAMEGFSLAFEDYVGDGKFGLQMPQWIEWWGQAWIFYIGWGVVGTGLLGWVMAMWKREWRVAAIGVVWLFALCNLGLRIPIVSSVGWTLREYVPYYDAIFRFAFTKFSLVYAMSLAVMMGYGLTMVLGWMKWGVVRFGITAGLVGVVIMWSFPVFRGELLYDKLRVELPSEYQELFRFMDSVESGRVLQLPQQDFWGWELNEWGYRGSGFVWQGINMPILDKAFYAWSPYNEGFYNEFATAIYACPVRPDLVGVNPTRSDLGAQGAGCSGQVQKVLQKYDVRYVLLDESVIAPGQDKDILRIEETKELAQELGWERVFNENFLSVWKIPVRSDLVGVNPTRSDLGITVPESYMWVEGDTLKTRKDVIYAEMGTYVEQPGRSDLVGFEKDLQPTRSDLESQGTVVYPFAQLMREEIKNIEYGDKGITLRSDLVGVNATRSDLGSRELVIPGWGVGEIVRVDFVNNEALPAYYINGEKGPRFLGEEKPKEGESYFYARVSEGEEWEEYRREQVFSILNDELSIEIMGEAFIYDFGRQGQGSIGNCDVLKRGSAEKERSTYMADGRGAVCDYVVMGGPFTRVPHLMRVMGENKAGRSLKFFLYNTGSERNDIEYLMDRGKFDQTFSLLPWDWDGHYSLNIETRSFGQYAENRVDKVEVRYAPIEKIVRAKLVPIRSDLVGYDNDLQPTRSDLRITHVKKTGTWLYGLGVRGDGLIRLSQGYDEGWVGLNVSSIKYHVASLRHLKVDGWANGFVVNNESGIMNNEGNGIVIIFYWPQLLQYLGFVLLGTTLVLAMMKRD
ncbi:hypothetical protein DCC61_00690 [Candidatus Microgenomates bacterium]|nr:MAG: hypothetical protein DCC61_00690 [Candidatus Microgenomates bacterium]